MILVVRNAQSADELRLLDDMHRLRYDIAVGCWGWTIPNVEPGYDKDEFDTSETIYLLNVDDRTGAVLATARLNPTLSPHMMTECFPDYCDVDEIPRDEKIYEFSRYVVDVKSLGMKEARIVRGELCVGIVEFCLDQKFRSLTWLSDLEMYYRSIRTWPTRPLGIPRYQDNPEQFYIAAISDMTMEGLAKTRAHFGIDYDVFAKERAA